MHISNRSHRDVVIAGARVAGASTASESGSRALLHMTTLCGALVAYGFLPDTDVAPAYLGVVLPIVFLVGTFTWERLVQRTLEDIIEVGGI